MDKKNISGNLLAGIFDKRENDISFKRMDKGSEVIKKEEKEKLVSILVNFYRKGSVTGVVRTFASCHECGGSLQENNVYLGGRITSCFIIIPGEKKRYIFNSVCLHRAEKHELRVSKEDYIYLKELLDFYS